MSKILILSHLGLGDNIFCIAIINYFLKQQLIVHYICKSRNESNFKLFFEKNSNLSLISVKNDKEAHKYISKNKKLYDKILKSGFHIKGSNINSFPFFQYDDIDLSRNILKTDFSIPDTEESYNLFENVKNIPYIVVNNQSSLGSIFNIDKELNKYKINPDDILVINTQTNYYNKEHKYYGLAQPFVFQKLIHYKKTLIHAERILISDSSMFCLAVQLELKNTSENKVYMKYRDLDFNTLLNFYDNKFTIGN